MIDPYMTMRYVEEVRVAVLGPAVVNAENAARNREREIGELLDDAERWHAGMRVGMAELADAPGLLMRLRRLQRQGPDARLERVEDILRTAVLGP